MKIYLMLISAPLSVNFSKRMPLDRFCSAQRDLIMAHAVTHVQERKYIVNMYIMTKSTEKLEWDTNQLCFLINCVYFMH